MTSQPIRLYTISWHWYRAWPSPIMRDFHVAVATGVACHQGTLTLPDTLFRPQLWDLLVLQLLRPDSSNLPCLYLTFHLEYPLVFSRFCLSPRLRLGTMLCFATHFYASWRFHFLIKRQKLIFNSKTTDTFLLLLPQEMKIHQVQGFSSRLECISFTFNKSSK